MTCRPLLIYSQARSDTHFSGCWTTLPLVYLMSRFLATVFPIIILRIQIPSCRTHRDSARQTYVSDTIERRTRAEGHEIGHGVCGRWGENTRDSEKKRIGMGQYRFIGLYHLWAACEKDHLSEGPNGCWRLGSEEQGRRDQPKQTDQHILIT